MGLARKDKRLIRGAFAYYCSRVPSKSVLSVFAYTYNINNTRVYKHKRIPLLLREILGQMDLWIFRKLFLSFHLSKQHICLCYLKHSVLYMLCHCEMNRVLD